MINMRRAFNRYTTTVAYLELPSMGYFNEYNEWVHGASTPPQPFRVTATPVGMADHASYGTVLEARPEGERVASFLQFSSVTEMPINSFIYYKEFKYKVIRLSDYRAAGFHTVVGENVRGKYDDF